MINIHCESTEEDVIFFSQMLTIANSFLALGRNLWPLPLVYARIFVFILSLCRFCAYCHRLYEFIFISTILDLETISPWDHLPPLALTIFLCRSLSLERRGMINISSLRVRKPNCIILSALASCAPLC